MSESLVVLRPPQAKGHTSVARVVDDWYVACTSRELRPGRVLARTILGIPLVVFRGDGGRASALLDRCPHRNAPLSAGRMAGGTVECGYHGWRFDGGGGCTHVPGLLGDRDLSRRRVASFACREQDGYVWVYATPDTEPVREPFAFPFLHERGYTSVRQQMDLDGSMHAAAENALDVPHTAFLHRGLFRGTGAKNRIEVLIRRWHDRVEAEYRGEPRPGGVVGRILAPRGGMVTHFDRFILPCIAQVEYRLGNSHLNASAVYVPVNDYFTRMYGVVSFRLPIPGWLIKPFLAPIAMRILRQDAAMLRLQSDTIRTFGGEQYQSTDLDVVGPHILRLLRDAEKGERAAAESPAERRIEIEV